MIAAVKEFIDEFIKIEQEVRTLDEDSSKTLKEIPLTLQEYFALITSCFGIFSIRHHLHEEKFYTHPFEVVPELKKLEVIFPEFKFPKINFHENK